MPNSDSCVGIVHSPCVRLLFSAREKKMKPQANNPGVTNVSVVAGIHQDNLKQHPPCSACSQGDSPGLHSITLGLCYTANGKDGN